MILVGELRDGETISMAMTAAETGHLVLGTLHTTSAVKSVDRIIDALPAEQREQTKSFLAHSLHAVVTQMLVKTPDSRGRRAIVEVHDHDPRDREAHHDRADAPDSGAAANRQGRRHAAHGSGAARTRSAKKSRSGRRLSLRDDRKKFERFVTDTTVLPSSAERRLSGERPMSLIDAFLRSMHMRKGSDLHVIAGDPPRMRVHGDLITLDNNRLDPEELKAELFGIMSEAVAAAVQRARLGRLRALHSRRRALSRERVPPPERHRRACSGASRRRRSRSTSSRCRRRCTSSRRATRGLILVTGKTGSGKSTTLAGVIDAINSRVKGHILTIEDPIEFVHQRKLCLISQREIGVHSPSFADALHSALREDPDAILVGELRDLETMSIAMTAAEMGVLVMGTLHTNGAAATIDRVVNIFPSDKQDHVRNMLSTSLRGVVSQQLLKRKDGTGRVAGTRDPDQHVRGGEPDPPGQARAARERDAVERSRGHVHDGHRRSRSCSRTA